MSEDCLQVTSGVVSTNKGWAGLRQPVGLQGKEVKTLRGWVVHEYV